MNRINKKAKKEIRDRVVARLLGNKTVPRQFGNTTRIIDAAIQTLFTTGEVTIVDHYPSDVASRRALKIMRERINREHPGTELIVTGPHSVKLKRIPR